MEIRGNNMLLILLLEKNPRFKVNQAENTSFPTPLLSSFSQLPEQSKDFPFQPPHKSLRGPFKPSLMALSRMLVS